jgi:hypothetical protein
MTDPWTIPTPGTRSETRPTRGHANDCQGEPTPGRGTAFKQVATAGCMLSAVVAINLARSGRPAGDDVLREVKASMFRILETAFDEAEVGWADCQCEGRGDTVIIATPPYVPTKILLDELVSRLRAGLRLHNKLSSDLAKIKFRLAVHVGQITFSTNGMIGHAIDRLGDLLEAPDFVREFTDTSADIGIVASDYLRDELIQHGPGLIDPTTYHLVKVPTEQGNTCGWMHFPPQPAPQVRPAEDPPVRDVA